MWQTPTFQALHYLAHSQKMISEFIIREINVFCWNDLEIFNKYAKLRNTGFVLVNFPTSHNIFIFFLICFSCPAINTIVQLPRSRKKKLLLDKRAIHMIPGLREIRREVEDLQKRSRDRYCLWHWWAIFPAERATTSMEKNDALSPSCLNVVCLGFFCCMLIFPAMWITHLDYEWV